MAHNGHSGHGAHGGMPMIKATCWSKWMAVKMDDCRFDWKMVD